MKAVKMVAVLVMVLVAATAYATTYTFEGPISTPGSLWSDVTNWSGGVEYPDDANDVGVINNHNEQVTYSAAASGVLGGMQIIGRLNSQRIIIDADVLLDYTGTTGDATTPAGWLYTRSDDNQASYVQMQVGKTLTLTGWKAYEGNYEERHIQGPGLLQFTPDASGKGYLYLGGNSKTLGSLSIDFSALTTIECMADNGTGVVSGSLGTTIGDQSNPANVNAWTIGRTDGATQTFAAKASVAGTASNDVLFFRPTGLGGRYGPKLVVNAVGTDAAPNLVKFDKEAFGGLAFQDSSNLATGGSWIESAGAGVARLVLEGNFTTGDNSYTDAQWDMSQVQLQMAGEQPASQSLVWCAVDRNAGGTIPFGDEAGVTGFEDNYAVRKLIIGSDEGTDTNHVNFSTTAGGAALYTWCLELTDGAVLDLGDDDYIYYLGNLETVDGIAGGGLVINGQYTGFRSSLLPFLAEAGDLDRIILLGATEEPVAEPAGLGLIGLALLGLRKKRS
jgi:hypothetical protein